MSKRILQDKLLNRRISAIRRQPGKELSDGHVKSPESQKSAEM